MILSSRSARPARGLVIAAFAALIPVIAGCEAGLNAPTQQWHQPTPGASKDVRGIQIRNMFILGAPPDSSLPPGSSTGVFFAVSNHGTPDTLLSMTAPGAAATVQLPGGQIALARQQTVLLTGPEPKVVLEDLTRQLRGGQYIRMVLDFQNAGSVPVNVPIMPKAQYYSTFSPAPSTSPSATPAASPSSSP